jgi:hypothetical protein
MPLGTRLRPPLYMATVHLSTTSTNTQHDCFLIILPKVRFLRFCTLKLKSKLIFLKPFGPTSLLDPIFWGA